LLPVFSGLQEFKRQKGQRSAAGCRNVGAVGILGRMKLLAVFQIVLLLATCVVPEGRHLLARSSGCANNCGCSEESRRAGNCCCAGKETTDSESAASETSRKACCQRAEKASKKSCCQSSACCTKSTTTEGNDPPKGVQISTCPCGGDVYEVMVIMMPRVPPLRVHLAAAADIAAWCCSTDDRFESDRPEPESPPPQNLPVDSDIVAACLR